MCWKLRDTVQTSTTVPVHLLLPTIIINPWSVCVSLYWYVCFGHLLIGGYTRRHMFFLLVFTASASSYGQSRSVAASKYFLRFFFMATEQQSSLLSTTWGFTCGLSDGLPSRASILGTAHK